MHEEILKTIEQIRAENNPNELVCLLKKLRKLLAEEQNRIEALLAKNQAAQAMRKIIPPTRPKRHGSDAF